MSIWNQIKQTASGRNYVTKLVSTGVTASLLMLSSVNINAAPGEIAQAPLFLAKAVQPNIFFMLDDSGSMDWEVLLRGGGGSGDLDFTPNDDTERREHCVGYNVLAYDPTTLTDNNKQPYTPWHGVDMNGDAFTDMSPTNAFSNPYTGGGDTTCHDNGMIISDENGIACNLVTGFGGDGAFYYPWDDADGDGEYDNNECDITDPQYVSDMSTAERINYANWFSYYRKREYVMKRALSQIIEASQERMGLGVINNSFSNTYPAGDNYHITKRTPVGTPVKNMDDLTLPVDAVAAANKATLIDNLLGVNSNGGTPLRAGLNNTGLYFQGQMNSNALFAGTGAPPNDPDSASGHSPILSDALGGSCQQNFAIVLSDGYWNGTPPSVIGGVADLVNTDIDGAGLFDGQSYGDSYNLTLADVAMHYYEIDLLEALDNDVPIVGIDIAPGDVDDCADVQTEDIADHPECFDTNTAQHLVTYTVAFGIRGTIPEEDGAGNPCVPDHRGETLAAQNWPSSCDGSLADGWPEPAANTDRTIDDMMHAAWNGRGQFLSAGDPQDLIDQLQAVISDISSKASVGMAAVAVDSTDVSTTDGSFFQAGMHSAGWSGNLSKYRFGASSVSLEWLAHELLDTRAYTDRLIVTYDGSVGVSFDFPSDYTNLGTGNLTQAQINDLLYNAPYSVSTTDAAEIAANQAYGEALVAYLFGDTTNENQGDYEFRNRFQHKLGDIVHSSPVYVGNPNPSLYASSTYQTWANTTAYGRQEMVYVGANDGALHAFDASTGNATSGQEVFAYFPQAVFSEEEKAGLHWLAKPGYEHRYYVDGEITVAEVEDLNGIGASTWGTVLIGTLRGGGNAIYAIDISDPSEFSSETGVAGNILWEFTADDLGYTFGAPTVAKLNDGRWAAIFGNGYNANGTGPVGEAGEAKLFIKYLDKKSPSSLVITTGEGSIDAASLDCLNVNSDCNGLSTPAVVDLGADNVADRVYAGDIQGNMWVFDLSDSSPANWVVENGAPLFTARSSTGSAQPITSQPYVILHPTERHGSTSPNTLVFFGTGQYLAKNDAASTGENSFYAIWDQGSGSGITGSRDSVLVEQTSEEDELAGKDIRLLTNNTVDYTTARGWYYDLPDTGERVIYPPLVLGQLVIYTTIVPEPNLCSGTGGYGWLMVHNLADGSEPDFIAINVNGDQYFNEEDQKDGENVGGVKTGSLSKPKFVKDGPGEGDILLPDDTVTVDPSLTRMGVKYIDFNQGRSSWGHYRKD